MSKQVLMSGCPALLLVLSGLIGCSQDSAESDIYSPPAPVVIRNGVEAESLRTRDGSSGALDFQDTISFTNSNPASAQVHTACRFRESTYVKDVALNKPTEIKVSTLLPEEMIPANLELNPAICTLQFNLKNEIGSQRIMPAVQIQLFDRQSAPIEISDDFRLETDTDSFGQVICTDVIFDAIQLKHDLQLNPRAFTNPKPREGRSSDVTFTRPLQWCRLRLNNVGVDPIYSKVFQFNLPVYPFQVKQVYSAPSLGSSSPDAQGTMEEFRSLKRIRLATFQITNPAYGLRRIVIPDGSEILADIGLVHYAGTAPRLFPNAHFLRGPWFHLRIENALGEEVKTSDRTVDLGQNESIFVSLYFEKHLSCLQLPVHAFTVTNLTSFTFEEQYETKESVGSTEVALPGTFVVDPMVYDPISHIGRLPESLLTSDCKF